MDTSVQNSLGAVERHHAEDDIRARVATASMAAMTLEVLARLCAELVRDRELTKLVSGAHGQALGAMMRLRRQLRDIRTKAEVNK
jgi:hypothetical protein